MSTFLYPDLAIVPYAELRPWGSFRVIGESPHYKMKLLTVKPGHRLSLQRHRLRSEHWIVTSGCAKVTVDQNTWKAEIGDHIYIPVMAWHRLANGGNEMLEIVEVQQGSSFMEDDIERREDDYNRMEAVVS